MAGRGPPYALTPMLVNAAVGIVAGGVVVAAVSVIPGLRGKPAAAH